MTLLGLELSDAGILVAGGNPSRLLEIDGQKQESPGFAIPEKNRLVVGNSAASKAYLFPLQVMNRFWDQLNTEPLERKRRHAQNHAEIACAHLSHIWENIKMHGDEMIIAVPDYYDREQLGLILGMAQELSIPINGFVSLPIAASFNPRPDAMLLHLDIHLHRFEIVYLHQDEYLTRENSLAVQEINLEKLYRGWVESIAEEFVRTTRFDPLHQAATEQELFNRLPAALEIFKRQSSYIFEISHGRRRYRTTLLWDLLNQKSEAVYNAIRRSIVKMRDAHKKNSLLTVLQLTHRIACLPGLRDKLSKIDHCEIMELKPGAGALGVLRIWDQLGDRHASHGASFFTSRPWRQAEPQASRTTPYKTPGKIRPTHLLYRDVAYPLSQKPLFMGCDPYPAVKGIYVQTQSSSVSKKHCTVHRDADRIILTDTSNQGTFLNDQRVDGSTTLELGQIVRLGTSGETFRLIACMETHET
ncbi:MAG: FHA domain-containing protein [Thermodesulfobacteriota bacterium]|nr:FHA domain-containing protein [Thermodesulfobacteriota bacterium]